jgi:hypothetical protein
MLLIDFRSGSVEMLQGLDHWHGELPMSKADCSQINTAQGIVILRPGPLPNSAFAPLLDQEA